MSDAVTALQPVHGESVALEPSRYDGLVMAVSPAEALKRVQELQAFVAQVMVKGTDYGVIPGTGNRPTLLQPGAQKLCEIYGFAVTFEDGGSTLDWSEPLFFFRKRCVLTSRRDGHFVCDGIGSCNSREDRYAWRWVGDRDLPKGVDKATLKQRVRRGRGETSWTQYRLPNEDLFSLVNTMEKIACKRALMHATTNATRSSGIFTQDVEDLPPEAFGQAEDARSWGTRQDRAAEPARTAAEDAAAAAAADRAFGTTPPPAVARPTLAELRPDILGARSQESLDDLVPSLRLLEAAELAEGRKLWGEQRERIRNGELPDPEPLPPPPAEPAPTTSRVWAMKQRSLGDDGERWVGLLEALTQAAAIGAAALKWPEWHGKDWAWEAHGLDTLNPAERQAVEQQHTLREAEAKDAAAGLKP